ncbi:unnamed protein product [Coffea canephora]|uniref:Alpha/beta hydrolase fold-3 domain-containing protein n=1 Tax=Coffea canephora TaxID=49390 RepID=A0A068UXM5_COFCA|nr:unnamed protein product [Coffea canephora]
MYAGSKADTKRQSKFSSLMADPIAAISFADPHADPYGHMGLVRNPDGSVTRQFEHPKTPVSSYDGSPILLVKDVPINQSKNTGARIFLPKEALESFPGRKLPLLIYFHSGGFVICSVATSGFDDFHRALATEVPFVVVSIEHRLAPEHRLPAAYEDCLEALHWIKNSQDEWLEKYADLSNSFLMGSSSGGNIAYHVGLSASSCVDDLKPLNIKGLILHQAFFGGNKRTESELRALNDTFIPPCVTDVLWELSLPVGADRDHEFSNPVLSIKPGQFDQIKALGWKILMAGYENDALFDRQFEIAKMLEGKGVPVVTNFVEGGYHGIDMFESAKTKVLCEVVKEFIISFVTTA